MATDFHRGIADWPPQLSDFVTVAGRVAFVSVLPITSNWQDQEQQPGAHYYHVAIQFLDNGVAEAMMASDQLKLTQHKSDEVLRRIS